MSRNNYHTHTLFCDGHDTPEALVRCALAQGCTQIGFSGHSYTDIPEDDPFCMSLENTAKYKAEINRLKAEYKDQIEIFLGVEQDYFSKEPTADYDYVIGSVHYVLKDGVYISVDESAEAQVQAVAQYYSGDFYRFAEDYYALVGDVLNKTRCDIVGHFDLITKFNENNALFETAHPRYVQAADAALEKLMQTDAIFEINSGAISRGYRTAPYPEERIIEKLRAAGKKLIYTSDCHDKKDLLFGIPE